MPAVYRRRKIAASDALTGRDPTNAHIEAGAQRGSGSFAVALAPGTQQATFAVIRLTAGQAVTVNLVAVDACGDWSSVVGAGASVP